MKHTVFQTLIQENKAVSFPVQCLDPVPLSAAEQEQRIAEGIQRELLLYDAGQTVYPSAQVSITAGDIDLVGSGEVAQRDRIAANICRSVSASMPG